MERSGKEFNNPKVYNVRGKRVVLDREVAAFIGVSTKVFNQSVKRNNGLFEEGIMFKLTKDECLRSQIVTLNMAQGNHLKYLPYAFTEEGVKVLEKVLKRSIPIEFEEPADEAEVVAESWSEGTVVLYQPNDEIKLDVRVENETVWLTQEQMALLFGTTSQNITIHIKNIYESNEVDFWATCKDFLQVQMEGDRRVSRYVKIYNLDLIISVGYRVNTKNGILFRQWATRVLRNFLLNRGSVEYRLTAVENKVESLAKAIKNRPEFLVEANIRKETLILNGQNVEANIAYMGIYRLAKHSIIVVDDYIDAKTLSLLHGVPSTVKIHIISDCKGSKDFAEEVERYRQEHPELNIVLHSSCGRFHDRYIFIDFKDPKNEHLYHCGASSKDAGNKITTIDEINDRTVYYPLFDELIQ